MEFATSVTVGSTPTSRITGFVNGETTAVVSGGPALDTTASSPSGAGRYPITVGLGTLAADNYDGIRALGDIYMGGYSLGFSVLPGDYNGDGFVSSADMSGVFGATVIPYNIFADLNGDGTVDINDVKIARSKLGTKLP